MSKGAMSGVDITQNVMDTWQDLQIKKKYRFVIYKIQPDDQAKGGKGSKVIDVVYTEKDRSKTWEDFCNFCDPRDSFFGVFDFSYKCKSDAETEKPILVTWNPDTCDIKVKMLYAASKDAIKKRLATGLGAEIQASDEDDMKYENIKKKLETGV